MMKKKLTALIVSMLALFLITGCSADDGGTKTDSASETSTAQDAKESTAASQGNETADKKQDVIGDKKAKEIALAKVPGARESDITEFKLETDDGRQKYDGEIRYKDKEYDFDIDAATGEILDWEEEDIRK